MRRQSESCDFDMKHEFLLLKRLTSWYFLCGKVNMESLLKQTRLFLSESLILDT